jgi:PAS domain S-box-containing protein
MEDYIVITDIEGNIHYINPSFCKRIGYTEAELLRMKVFELHTKEELEEAKLFYKDILENYKKVQNLEITAKDNKKIPVRTKIWKGKWNDKDCYFSIVKDMTEEIEKTAKYDKLFYKNPAIMIIATMGEGRFHDINDSFTNVLGYTREDVIGRRVDKMNFIVDKENLQEVSRQFELEGKIHNFDMKIRGKDGAIYEGLISGEPIEDKGEIYFLAVMTDITKQKKVEKDLEEKTRLQRMLMDIASKYINIPLKEVKSSIEEALELMGEFIGADRVYVLEHDLDKNKIFNSYEWCREEVQCNKEKISEIELLNLREWILINTRGKILIVSDTSKMINNDYMKDMLQEQGIKSMMIVPMMLRHQCLGFVGFDYVRAIHEYNDMETELIELFAQMLVNIKSREKQENKLVESLEEKATLMKEIHHRVKNNLQVISSLLYLQSNHIEDPEIKKILKISENRIIAMATLHEKIYQSKEFSKFDFKAYVEAIIEHLVSYYTNEKFKLKLNMNIERIYLSIDKAIICGLIINELITNAIQHAFTNKDKGTVAVAIKEQDEWITMEIADNGKGMPQNINYLKTQSLGIQLVENLVKQLKGTLSMESEKGTLVFIKFRSK